MTENHKTVVEPRVLEVDALMKEGDVHWRSKQSQRAEQNFLRAAELRAQLGLVADNLLREGSVDIQKVDRILAETLNNFAVINLDQNRPERALELANKAVDLLVKTESFDQPYLDALTVLREIHEQLNRQEEASYPKPTIRAAVRKASSVQSAATGPQISFAPGEESPSSTLDIGDRTESPASDAGSDRTVQSPDECAEPAPSKGGRKTPAKKSASSTSAPKKPRSRAAKNTD